MFLIRVNIIYVIYLRNFKKILFLFNLLFCIFFVLIDINYGFLISYFVYVFISLILINVYFGLMVGEMFIM